MGHLDGVARAPEPASGCFFYLDHAATTPLLPEVLDTMAEELARLGNPSSLHNAGRRARRVVEESREQIAESFGARPSEVIFTSGGTEADNLAVKGLYWARRVGGAGRRRGWPGHEGAEVSWLPVDSAGLVRPDALRAAIGTDPASVALVSIMGANNEVGTVQPVCELAAVAREHGILFHS